MRFGRCDEKPYSHVSEATDTSVRHRSGSSDMTSPAISYTSRWRKRLDAIAIHLFVKRALHKRLRLKAAQEDRHLYEVVNDLLASGLELMLWCADLDARGQKSGECGKRIEWHQLLRIAGSYKCPYCRGRLFTIQPAQEV